MALKDQYDVSDPEQVAAQEQFFQWQLVESGFFGACRVAKVENRPLNRCGQVWFLMTTHSVSELRFYMAINVGSAFAYSFLTTLGTNGGPGIPKEGIADRKKAFQKFEHVLLGRSMAISLRTSLPPFACYVLWSPSSPSGADTELWQACSKTRYSI